MKTLLEFLEENRSALRDGIYEVSGMGSLVFNGKLYSGDLCQLGNFAKTNEKHHVENGVITKIKEWLPQQAASKQKNKYNRQCKGVTIDVYDVLKAFEVTDPALQHLIKKALCAGLRGHKNKEQDLIDIFDSANRALELYHDDNGSTERSPEVSGVR